MGKKDIKEKGKKLRNSMAEPKTLSLKNVKFTNLIESVDSIQNFGNGLCDSQSSIHVRTDSEENDLDPNTHFNID